MNERKTVQTWTRTSVQNLVRHRSGRYYARTYSAGKETWKSLKTDILEVAKVKLRDHAAGEEKMTRATAAQDRGRMTMGDCATIFLERVKAGHGLQGRGKRMRRITESSQLYRAQTVEALWKSWPALKAMDSRKVSAKDVGTWADKFAVDYSPTRFNNTLDTLRALFRVAEDAGSRSGNPAAAIGRAPVKQKTLTLPERGQFTAFVTSIRTNGAWCSAACADLVSFLAFTGARKDEAANVLWSDVDFTRGRIHLRVCKGGAPRHVPMIAEARELLTAMKAKAEEEGAALSDPVLQVHEAQKAMDAAAKKVGFARITHHDLRHLFATACIEAGVDIPTVSRWLGHKDGGALAMRTYGHLRDEHSQAQAKRVSFAPVAAAANVLEFGKAGVA